MHAHCGIADIMRKWRNTVEQCDGCYTDSYCDS